MGIGKLADRPVVYPSHVDVVTCKAQVDSEGVGHVTITVPALTMRRYVSRADGKDLGQFMLDEVFRRAIEAYVW